MKAGRKRRWYVVVVNNRRVGAHRERSSQCAGAERKRVRGSGVECSDDVYLMGRMRKEN